MAERIAICDDNSCDTAFVQDLLHQWSVSRSLPIICECFSSAESFLFRYEECADFDLLLLDVEMGKMDGVELARRIRQKNELVQIVFITGYSDYISEGYEVEALHYLMKPLRQEKFFAVLDRAWEKLQKNARYLNLECSEGLVRLPFYEIRYLDVHQNYVTVHAHQDHTVKRPLREFEAQLDERFFRAGRALILNLEYIRRVTRQEVSLLDGTVLPLPRGAYDPLNKAIIHHS